MLYMAILAPYLIILANTEPVHRAGSLIPNAGLNGARLRRWIVPIFISCLPSVTHFI